MKKTYLFLLLSILFSSIYTIKVNSQEINADIEKSASSTKEKDSLNKNSQNQSYPIELFNTKLVGLGIRDSTAVDPYKRYWIDFDAYCYSSTISFYIDTLKNKIYAIEYDFENTSITKDKILFQFSIEKIINDENSYQFFLNEYEQFILEDDQKVEEIETVFNFTKLDTVYQLEIKNNLPIFYSEVNRYKFFITKKEEGKFQHEGCGDFDG